MAARVAVSTAITAGVGWAAGDIGAGLIATLGVFTADYGTDRPMPTAAFSRQSSRWHWPQR